MTFTRIFLPPPQLFLKKYNSRIFSIFAVKTTPKHEKDWFIDHLSDRSVLVGGS